MIYSSFVTKKEVSRILGISVEKVEELIDAGELEKIEFEDKEVRILMRSVAQYKRRQDQ